MALLSKLSETVAGLARWAAPQSGGMVSQHSQSGSSGSNVRPQPRMHDHSGGICYMCDEPGHKSTECVHQQRFIRLGWLVRNAMDTQWVLKGGVYLPKLDPSNPKSKKDRIEEVAKKYGWDKENQPAEQHLYALEEEEVLGTNQHPAGNTFESIDNLVNQFSQICAHWQRQNNSPNVETTQILKREPMDSKN